MTTPEAEEFYREQHNLKYELSENKIHNPHNKPIEELPYVIGFNNGGASGWYEAIVIAEDGTVLGSHICSHESYMKFDLGILENSRPDRHVDFEKHYPDGYKTIFIPESKLKTDELFKKVIASANEKHKE